MRLTELVLDRFRNYAALHLTFDAPVTLFVGRNAQGKTNLLEAIHVLAFARSHRSARDRELVQWGQEAAGVKGRAEREDGRRVRLEVRLGPKGKTVKVNGVEKRRLSEYVGHLNAVLFAPEDLSLVKGSPQHRRRFLDMAIGQVSSAYLHDLSAYLKTLAQRNELLKTARTTGRAVEPLLSVYDEQLATLAAKLLRKRLAFVRKLEGWARAIHAAITQETETLSLRYVSTVALDAVDVEEEAVRARVQEELARLRPRERERGVTLVGPHRDDLAFFVNGYCVQTFGSQGQQRTVALALKLAEIEFIREAVGEAPILLLDDVLSELDASRQLHLLSAIQDRVQTFVTATGVEGVDHELVRHAARYRVEQGQIQPEG